jgi:leader peptidase (prepilin peptidase) / N-methyltransferase
LLFLLPVFSVLGLFIGSFLNVCIDRLPRGESIAFPPSHCTGCQHKLGFFDLIPLVSFLWLRGRCRYCRAAIPKRIPVVEATTSLLFSLLYWKYGPGIELTIILIYTCIFIVIFFIDLEHMLVLDVIVFPGMVFALAASLFWPGIKALDLPLGMPMDKIYSALIGGVIGLAAMALPYIIYRRGMGMGDIKLAAFIGLAAGFPSIFVALLLAVISGGLIAGALLLFKIKKRTDAIPFAPFLVVAAMVTLLWGQNIMNWYLG